MDVAAAVVLAVAVAATNLIFQNRPLRESAVVFFLTAIFARRVAARKQDGMLPEDFDCSSVGGYLSSQERSTSFRRKSSRRFCNSGGVWTSR